MNHIEIYKDKSLQYRWRMSAENGEPICCPGESFKSVQGLKKNLAAVFNVGLPITSGDGVMQTWDGHISLEWPKAAKKTKRTHK